MILGSEELKTAPPTLVGSGGFYLLLFIILSYYIVILHLKNAIAGIKVIWDFIKN